MARIAVDASRLLAAAGTLARELRHERVEPEHLLFVLTTEPAMMPVLARLAVDRERLEKRIKEHFAEWPIAGLYRDPRAEPVVSDRLRLLFDQAGARRLVSLVWPLTVEQLGRAACSAPSLVPLVMAGRSEIGTGRDAIAHARMLASSRGDPRLSTFHLAHVFAAQAWLGMALRRAGGDPEAFQAALERRMSKAGRLGIFISRLEAPGAMLGALLRSPPIASVLSELEISLYDVLRGLVDSAADQLDDDSLPEADGTNVEIVFHNDDVTTMAFVMDTLTHDFDVPDASRLARKIHRGGPEVVAVFPADDARRRLQTSRERARREAMPLRITWRRRIVDS